MVANQSFPNKLSPNYKIFYRKFYVPWMKCHMTFGINAVCTFMYRMQERQFFFSEICRQSHHFENGYHKITISLENMAVTSHHHGSHFKCSLPERKIDNEVHAVTPVSWNWLQFKIYLLDQGSVRQIATGHLTTSSHNFARRGVINHDRTTKLTLLIKYDPNLPCGYPKVAYPLEISFWVRNLFTHGQALPGRFAIDS